MGFNYVNIVTKGCEGWLNLFVDDHIIALVQDIYLANRIRALATERHNKQIIPDRQAAAAGHWDVMFKGGYDKNRGL